MSRKLILLLLTSLFIQDVYTKEVYSEDVSRFIEKREQCDYFRGKVSDKSDIDNAKNLNEQFDKYCKGIDRELEILKSKYTDNKSVLEKLNTYELIECTYNCGSELEVTAIKPQFSDYATTRAVSKTRGKYSANFAGHYYVSTMGCGGGAICGKIINIDTGKTVTSFPNAYLIEDDNGNDAFTLDYKPNSSLIIISGIAADTEFDSKGNLLEGIYCVRYYKFTNEKLVLIKYDTN